MNKFLVVYRMSEAAMAKAQKISPAEREQSMRDWFAWRDSCGASIVDFGGPIMGSAQVGQGSSQIAPGALGYSILQANSMDEAKKLVANHPHIQWSDDCTIELYETLSPPQP